MRFNAINFHLELNLLTNLKCTVKLSIFSGNDPGRIERCMYNCTIVNYSTKNMHVNEQRDYTKNENGVCRSKSNIWAQNICASDFDIHQMSSHFDSNVDVDGCSFWAHFSFRRFGPTVCRYMLKYVCRCFRNSNENCFFFSQAIIWNSTFFSFRSWV